ncbi:MAG: hypothetical protein LKF87_10100 [Clostridium tyrobutyricum]|jgi:hypothetical protein|uniref:hypothetical protein n=2 Tax=Clostridium tyrobutyricum TaxID=1519 RepID=UPI0011CBBC4F|nr:hypothetical protein [Clostridium tyrobutyricum]MCH4259301.1 hypothetical protein [Clostridium tyrobutyricum]
MNDSKINIAELDDIGRIELAKILNKKILVKNFLDTVKILQNNINLQKQYNSLQTDLSKDRYNKNFNSLNKKLDSINSNFMMIAILYIVWCILDFILTHTISGHIMEILNRSLADLCYKAFVIILGLPYLIFTKAFNYMGLTIDGFSIINLSTKVMSHKYLGEVCIGFFMIPVIFFIIRTISIKILKVYLNKHLRTLDNIEYKKDLEKYNCKFLKNSQLKQSIIDKLNTNKIKINNTSIIPKAYRFNYNAVIFFIYCLSNGRADNLKECINLYHTESYRNNILSYMKSIEWNINNLYSLYENISFDLSSLNSQVSFIQNQNTDILNNTKR